MRAAGINRPREQAKHWSCRACTVRGGPGQRRGGHGDMIERKMWSASNSEHAELFGREVAYWADRWNEYQEQKSSIRK